MQQKVHIIIVRMYRVYVCQCLSNLYVHVSFVFYFSNIQGAHTEEGAYSYIDDPSNHLQ